MVFSTFVANGERCMGLRRRKKGMHGLEWRTEVLNDLDPIWDDSARLQGSKKEK